MMEHRLTILSAHVFIFFSSPSCLSEEQPELTSCSLSKFSQPATCPSTYCFKACLNGSFLIPAVGNRLSNKLFCYLILYKSSLPADPWLSGIPVQKLGILIFLSVWVKQICTTAIALWPAEQLQTEALVYISVSALLLINKTFISFQLFGF